MFERGIQDQQWGLIRFFWQTTVFSKRTETFPNNIKNDIWWHMMTYDDIWYIIMIYYYDVWWYMVIFDDIWWHIYVWWYLMQLNNVKSNQQKKVDRPIWSARLRGIWGDRPRSSVAPFWCLMITDDAMSFFIIPTPRKNGSWTCRWQLQGIHWVKTQ